ncbi:MAG: fibronectin type III domain-containing protein [Patescibacteria group bacterium]|jgi:hypothetical protein
MHKVVNHITGALLIFGGLTVWYFFHTTLMPPKVQAASRTVTSRSDFELGLQNGTNTASKEGTLSLQPDGAWGPRAFKTPNLTLGDQAAIASDGEYVYILHNADNHFVRYIPSENKWKTLAPAPKFSYPGAQLVVLGNYIYAEFGGYQKEFYRYSIQTNTWEALSNMLDLVYGGASCSTDGTNIFCLRGTSTTDFWKYTVATNTWSGVSNPALAMYNGAILNYYDGNFYALRGGGTTTMYRYNVSANSWHTTTTNNTTPLAVMPASNTEDKTAALRGDEIFVTRGQATQTFYKYNISSNTWTTLTNTPQATRYVGAVYNAADDYVYVFRGNGQYDFWKYNPTTNVFLGPTDLPNTPGSGADITYYNGFIYYARGNNSALYYRYEVATGIWTTLTSAPVNFNDDTKGVLVGSDIYYYRGSGGRDFYKYSTTGGTWTTLAALTPVAVNYGATLVYPGSGDFIYGTRGAVTRIFWRYQISTDTWSDPAVADLPDNAEAAYGSRLTSDGTDIYYSSGYGTSSLLKYVVGTNTWTVVNSLPFTPHWGTDMRYYGGKIFFQAGYYKPDFWEYIIATNSWRRLPDLQSTYYYSNGPYNGGSLTINSSNGAIYSISGQNLLGLHQYTPSAYNYVASGSWTSNVLDLNYVQSFASLIAWTTTPDDSSIIFETRTSSDQVTWSGWQTVSGTAIASNPARYIQVRATLAASTGRSQTPSIQSLQINYTGDEIAPSNPATFSGLSQAAGGVAITSGQSYKHTSPYISWTVGSDSQMSVAGYYVYFGTNSAADPQTLGALQTELNYLVTQPMIKGETYYLRLKTKDTSNNVSAAVTGFVYTYIGVSPPQTVTKTSTEDFLDGVATNISTQSGKITLSPKAGFWQQERLTMPPAGIYYGSDLAYVSSTNKMYLNRGYGSTTFYEYDLTTDVWTTKGALPATAYYGDDVIEGPAGYLYGTRGQNTTSFWSYNISENTWSDSPADAPQPISYGGSLVYDGGHYIYALKGNSDDTFMRYDTDTDNWETLANIDFGAPERQVNNVVQDGGDLAMDRTNNIIYVMQGSARSGFATYDVSNNSWTQLPNLPALAAGGANIEFDETTNAIYFLAGWNTTLFFKYDIASQTWSTLPDAPLAIAAGSTLRNVNGVLYVIRGGGGQQFYKYNIAKQSWMIPNVGLFNGWFRGNDVRTFSYGADIIRGDGNNFYLVRGNFDNLFSRYNPLTGEITKLADAPAGFYNGGKLVYESTHNKIYATTSSYYRKLFIYDIATDVWSEETLDPPPFDPDYGTSMVYDGAQYIYWTQGQTTQRFYRFNTQGTAGAKWSAALANPPGTLQYGSDLVIKNDYLYALRGQNTVAFYRYGPLSGTPVWSDPAVADLPTGALVYNDGFLVDGGNDLLYACRGGNQVGCYSYSISGNSWTAIANAPAQIYTGGSGAAFGTEKMLVIAGGGTNTYTNGLYTYVMQSDTTSFQESGSYISGSIDLTAVYRFANLNLNYVSATNSAIAVSTRTSSDNATWDEWQLATSEKIVGTNRTYKIGSATKRYLQVKFDLTSGDGVYSPTINDYTISYYQDVDEPINPTSVLAYTTATKSAALTSGNWYNHTAPYFEWPDDEVIGGATDGANGAGIAGYYVYFDASPSADIITEGTYQTTTHLTPTNLTAGQTYYLRIKTKDNAGNISSGEYAAFTYKFNDQKPDNPTTLIVDPPGPTNVNSYNFSWSEAAPDLEYCYKTGAIGSSELCTYDLSVSSISAYQEGNNTFYLRTKDVAGNYAVSYKTVTYQLLETAPGPVQSLQVSPEHSTTGEFAFTWQPPAYFGGTQAGLKYYYSINALPTAGNVTLAGSQSYLPSDFYASQVGKNTIYIVSKDEVGNMTYNTHESVDFYADTSAPGIPTDVDIADVSVKETSKWRLAITWDAPVASGSAGVAYYEAYRSTETSANCTTDMSSFSKVASYLTDTSFVNDKLTQTDNYFCVKACNVTNQCSAPSSTVKMYPDGKWRVAPDLVASQSATVKTKSAIIEWSTSRKSNSFVKYGKTSGTYDNEAGSSDPVTLHSIALNSLDPGTTYYYQAVWTDEDGNTGKTEELSFTTNPAPFVSAVKITDVSLYSAFVTFTVKNSTQATIEYGPTINYGSSQSIATATGESEYTVSLTNLAEGTPYHLRLVGKDEEGNTFAGDDYTFETLPVPKITATKLQQVAGMAMATFRVVWTSNAPVSSIVTYYPANNPSAAKDQITLALKLNHEMIIKDLLDDTDYIVLIKGKDSAGNEAVSAPLKAKTAVDFRPPEILNLNVESTITGIGSDAKAQIIASWDTDEPATTQVEYAQGTGTSYGQTTQEDTNKTTNHIVTVTGLSPARIYHLRAISKDKAANIAQSADSVIVTPKSTQDALTLVVENLAKTFGFLKNVGK